MKEHTIIFKMKCKSVANQLQIIQQIIVQTFYKSSVIIIIIGDSHKRGEMNMKRKVVIIPDNVVLYIRVATEEQASNSDTLVLKKKKP